MHRLAADCIRRRFGGVFQCRRPPRPRNSFAGIIAEMRRNKINVRTAPAERTNARADTRVIGTGSGRVLIKNDQQGTASIRPLISTHICVAYAY